jgi:hypothetical protein
MPEVEQELSGFPDDLGMLDNLIRRSYKELLETKKESAKLGDLIKMIELRRKLAPGDADQQEFWKMLEQIRREALQAGDTKRPRQSKKTTTKTTKK